MLKTVVFLLILSLLISVSAPCLANVVPDLSDLTEEEKATLVLEAKKLRDNRTGDVVNSKPKVVNEWIDVGKNLGLALTSTAKELGVAMDAFLSSKTGQIATYVILWKLLWKDVVGVVVGFLLLLTFIPTWIYMYRKMCIIKSMTVTYADPSEKGTKKKVKTYEYYPAGPVDGTRLMMGLMLIVIVVGPLFVIF